MYFELAFEELVGNDRGSGEGNVGGSYAFPEEAKVLVQFPHVVRAPWSSEVVLSILIPLMHPI